MTNPLTNILDMAKQLLTTNIKPTGIYADFTMGNGNDTLYIKKTCPHAKIYAFDIQQTAIDNTRKKLENKGLLDSNIQLILDSHENFANHISENIDGAIFNLGYLPGGNKEITTKAESTLRCLKSALNRLNPGGVIVVALYPGHPAGAIEAEAIVNFSEKIDSAKFLSLLYKFTNTKNSPFILAFQKRTKTQP